jgi:16S rRNA (cytosine1402-N4)-methyltransferase
MSQKNDLNANRVVNEYDEANLKECSWIMEIEKCPVLARTIVESREQQPLQQPMS